MRTPIRQLAVALLLLPPTGTELTLRPAPPDGRSFVYARHITITTASGRSSQEERIADTLAVRTVEYREQMWSGELVVTDPHRTMAAEMGIRTGNTKHMVVRVRHEFRTGRCTVLNASELRRHLERSAENLLSAARTQAPDKLPALQRRLAKVAADHADDRGTDLYYAPLVQQLTAHFGITLTEGRVRTDSITGPDPFRTPGLGHIPAQRSWWLTGVQGVEAYVKEEYSVPTDTIMNYRMAQAQRSVESAEEDAEQLARTLAELHTAHANSQLVYSANTLRTVDRGTAWPRLVMCTEKRVESGRGSPIEVLASTVLTLLPDAGSAKP